MHRLVIANPPRVRAITHAKIMTDKIDEAVTQPHLLRTRPETSDSIEPPRGARFCTERTRDIFEGWLIPNRFASGSRGCPRVIG